MMKSITTLLLLCFYFSLSAAVLPNKVIRGPYLQLGTPTSVVVRWRTESTNVAVVYYGLTPNKLTSQAKASGLQTEHVVLLSGLKPSTTYFYAIGQTNWLWTNNGVASFTTSPEQGSEKSIRVWIIGDPGTQFKSQTMVRDAYYKFTKDRHTDVMLALGDNAYSYGRDYEYQGGIFDVYTNIFRETVFWPTLGNHDARTADSATQSGVFYDIFTLPTMAQAGGVMSGTEAYYSFNYGNTHFVCFNSCDVDRSSGSPMLDWLKRDLAANKLDWTIAYFHHPPYTKGSHNSDDKNGENIDLTEIRQNVIPILEEGGTDLVLTGHSHDYERSWLLNGHYGYSDTFNDSYKKNKGDGREDGNGAYLKPTRGPAPHEGTVYVVAGSSGKITGGSLNHAAMFFSTNSLGSLVLDIKGPRLDASFINEKGEKLDHFTMRKGRD